MSTYQLFTNKDEKYECAKPSIKAARDYAKLMIKCAPRPMSERLELATQYGWDTNEVKDEIFFDEYQKRRAGVLFPHHINEITQNTDFLNVSEVDKAEGFFTKATGIALRPPSVSLSELGSFLTALATQSKTEDTSPAGTTETGGEQ